MNRTKADLVMALALLHHLAIGKNIPFSMIADMFHHLGQTLIIEFIPKDDEKVKLMLTGKKDIYKEYNEEIFLTAFEKYFSIAEKVTIPGSQRILFLMRKNS